MILNYFCDLKQMRLILYELIRVRKLFGGYLVLTGKNLKRTLVVYVSIESLNCMLPDFLQGLLIHQ